MKINSLTNPRIKRVVNLKNSRERKETGLTVVDGVHEIRQAVGAGIKLDELYICPDLAAEKIAEKDCQALAKHAKEVIEVSPEVFEKIAFGNRREGLLAVCSVQTKSLSAIKLRENPLIVIVDHIEKPGNLGAILRSCDGAGVDFLCVCNGLTDVFNPHVIRASLGAVFTVPVVHSDSQTIRDFLKQKKIKIYAASPDAKTLYTQADFSLPTAVVLGSEHQGLADSWRMACDGALFIPMKGKADSLNVSASTAVILYEAVRQRNIFESQLKSLANLK